MPHRVPQPRSTTQFACACRRFIILAGGKDKIVEYNQARSKPTTGTRTLTRRSRVPLHVHTQEACRLHSFDGRKSLIRSFPCAAPNCTHTHSPDSAQTTRSRARAHPSCAQIQSWGIALHTRSNTRTPRTRARLGCRGFRPEEEEAPPPPSSTPPFRRRRVRAALHLRQDAGAVQVRNARGRERENRVFQACRCRNRPVHRHRTRRHGCQRGRERAGGAQRLGNKGRQIAAAVAAAASGGRRRVLLAILAQEREHARAVRVTIGGLALQRLPHEVQLDQQPVDLAPTRLDVSSEALPTIGCVRVTSARVCVCVSFVRSLRNGFLPG